MEAAAELETRPQRKVLDLERTLAAIFASKELARDGSASSREAIADEDLRTLAAQDTVPRCPDLVRAQLTMWLHSG